MRPRVLLDASLEGGARRAIRPCLLLLALVAACGGLRLAPGYSPEGARNPDERFERFLEEVSENRLDRDPELATRLGDRRGLARWTDRSERARREGAQLIERDLERLRREFSLSQLDSLSREEYRAFEKDSQTALEAYRWRDHEWPFGPIDGLQVRLPTLLAHEHPLVNEADVEAWLARLASLGELAGGLVEEVREREQSGLLPPRFVLEAGIEQVRRLLVGAPFDASAAASDLLAVFARRLEAMGASTPEGRERHLDAARIVLRDAFAQGWRALLGALEHALPLAVEQHGVWRFPDGDAFYAWCLRRATGLDLDAETLHRDSMAEVRLLQEDLRTLKDRLGFAGSLNAFFDHLRGDPRLRAGSDADSRAAVIASLRRANEDMLPRLGEIFPDPPDVRLEILALGTSFALPGSGSLLLRSNPHVARWLVDFGCPDCIPTFELEARAYGEGLPGRTLLESRLRAERSTPIPPRNAATPYFASGWSSYAEGLAKELGAYQAPYSDLGRLTRQLASVAEVVVDTGVHVRRWSFRQALDYFLRNTACSEEEAQWRCLSGVTRPGWSAATPVGRAQILELRASATRRLGSRFDLTAFHDALVGGAGLPWTVLAQRMSSWSPALPR